MKHNVFGLMLATTVALSTLAGCNMPMTAKLPAGSNTGVTQPSTGGKTGGSLTTGTNVKVVPQLAPTKQAAAVETTSATSAALADAAELNAYDTMAAQEEMAAPKMYAVTAVDENGKPLATGGEVNITSAIGVEGEGKVTTGKPGDKLKDVLKGKREDAKKAAKALEKAAELKKKLEKREVEHAAKMAKQLEKMKGDRDKLREHAKNVKWVDNGDGTETKTYEFSAERTVNGKTASRTVKIVRTRNVEGKQLLTAHAEFSQTEPSGLTRSSMRDRVLQEDGSYKVTFDSSITFKDGTTRTAHWDKTISADGAVTGTGTIVWTGKVNKTVNITLGGTEDTETAKVDDAETKTQTEVTATVEGQVTAEAKDPETGEATEVKVEADAAVTTDAGTGTATGGANQGIAVGEPNPTGDATAPIAVADEKAAE